jgi:hypothetical protein
MRKIILMISVSLDGFIEGPDRQIDWHLVDVETIMALKAQPGGDLAPGVRTSPRPSGGSI